MATILIIAFTNIAKDPRVSKQIEFLSDKYRVIVVGAGKPICNDLSFHLVKKLKKNLLQKILSVLLLLTRRYDKYYWSDSYVKAHKKVLSLIKADLIIANDIMTLPLALECANGAKVLFDAHEYAPGEFDDNLVFRFLYKDFKLYLCKKYIPRTDVMTTVCEGLADLYYHDTGIMPGVITNASFHKELAPSEIMSNGNKIKMVHHGNAVRSRKIERHFALMDLLDDRFELYLMLIDSSKNYLSQLKKIAKKYNNVFFIDPVPMDLVPATLNKYDIGIYLLKPNNTNNKFSLPNKLFDFIQANLAVAISPLPEMAKIVCKYGFGIVADGFSIKAMAEIIKKLDVEQIYYYKQRANQTAKEVNAENNGIILRNIVKKALNG